MKALLKKILPESIIKFLISIDHRHYKVVKNPNNKKYNNIASKKRCFILGNGPSLNDINIELLKDEDVFTVNQLNRSAIFNKISPKYHCVADDDFFFLDENNPGEAERLKYIKKLQDNKGLVCIFPFYSKPFFDSFNLTNETIYFSYCSDATRKEIKKIDLVKGIPTIRTVVQVAIYSAIYFGYKEIYLLGVENTNYQSLLNNIEEGDNLEEAHIYRYSDEEKKKILNKKRNHNNEFVFKNFYHLFKIYKNINEYCLKNNITIKNLTGKGILDVFDNGKLENICK